MYALFDLDTFVYQAGFSSEKVRYDLIKSNNDRITLPAGTTKVQTKKYLNEHPNSTLFRRVVPLSLDFALNSIEALIQQTLLELKSLLDKDIVFKGYLTGANDTTNFRYSIARTKPYKGQRKATERPFFYEDIRNHLISVYKAEVVLGMEADDAVSIEQRANIAQSEESIIIGIDKDLLQIPGWHYNFRTKDVKFISPLEGARNLYKQVLTGDNADNIPGLQGVGPITAEKLLSKCKKPEEMRKIVYTEYEKRGKLELFEEVYNLCKLLEKRNETN